MSQRFQRQGRRKDKTHQKESLRIIVEDLTPCVARAREAVLWRCHNPQVLTVGILTLENDPSQ